MLNTHLPHISTQTAELINDPNALVGRGADRLTVVEGDYGIELLEFGGVQFERG